MKNEVENKQNKLNKNSILFKILIFAVLLTGGILGVFYLNNNSGNPPVNSEYEVLDENVISTDIMKRWVEENAKGKGVFTTSDNDYTYVLISYGETKTPNIGICLEKISFSNNVDIKYSIVSSQSENEVEAYTPKMILRFKGQNIKIKYEEINPS